MFKDLKAENSSRVVIISLDAEHGYLQIRETDLDELERVVGVVAFGDLEAEDTRNLNQLNFQRLLRLSQLATEYLLHVQDRLAYDNGKLKVTPVIVTLSTAAFAHLHLHWDLPFRDVSRGPSVVKHLVS